MSAGSLGTQWPVEYCVLASLHYCKVRVILIDSTFPENELEIGRRLR